MADYFSLEEVLGSTENMTYIRNNQPNDDSVDTVAGVDWFLYNGVPAATLYISGNSFIGIGSNAEHLKVCRRDGKVYTLRREEGTIYGCYRFLHIRWEGYSAHNSTSADLRLVWDMVMLDIGDIALRLEAVPTNPSYMGVSALVTGAGTISFEPTADMELTFQHQDESGTAFQRIDGLPLLLDPYNRRYLISDSTGSLYTIVEGVLSKLEENELTAEAFETYGVQDIPDGNLLLGLTEPTILYWHDSQNRFPPFHVSYTGVPKPQVIFSENIDMSDRSILGIEKVIADADDATLFSVSFDAGKHGGHTPPRAGHDSLRQTPGCPRLSWRVSARMPGQKRPSPGSSCTVSSSAARRASCTPLPQTISTGRNENAQRKKCNRTYQRPYGRDRGLRG